jgi:ankyrin repeat protein
MSGSQSTDALVEELVAFCRSESLSEDGLREIFERQGCAPNNNNHVYDYDFFLWACRNERVTEEIIRCLLEYFPDAGVTSAEGYVPLQFMCLNKNATRGMVQLLIDAYPESLGRANNNGWMPLHILCQEKDIADSTAVDILGPLLQRYPEALRHAAWEAVRPRTNGALPIHIAAGQGSKSVEFCRMLIEAYPGSERIAASGNALLPIHFACRYGTVETAQYLLRLYPESINVATRGGAYPIHSTIGGLDKRTNPAIAVDMIQFLLDSDPNVVALQKIHGRFPLVMIFIYACNNRNNASILNAAMKILRLLYDAHPEIIEDDEMAYNINRRDILVPEEIQTFINTQLNLARLARNSTVRQMKKRDENGQAPLHRALRDNVTLGSLKLLVKRNPSVVLVPDNSGALPLHVAIHNDSTKVVDYLVGLDSDTLTAVDREGNTALHLACRAAKYDTIALLLEKYGAVSVSQGNALNKLPIHLLLESDATASRDDTKYLESVFQLLRLYPETVMVSEDAKQASIPQGGRPSRSGKKRKYYA